MGMDNFTAVNSEDDANNGGARFRRPIPGHLEIDSVERQNKATAWAIFQFVFPGALALGAGLLGEVLGNLYIGVTLGAIALSIAGIFVYRQHKSDAANRNEMQQRNNIDVLRLEATITRDHNFMWQISRSGYNEMHSSPEYPSEVKVALARNPNIDEMSQCALAQWGDDDVKVALSDQARLCGVASAYLSRTHNSSRVREALASSPAASTDDLRCLAEKDFDNEKLTEKIALNSNCPEETLILLSDSIHAGVRARAALKIADQNCIQKLKKDSDSVVIEFLVNNDCLPIVDLVHILENTKKEWVWRGAQDKIKERMSELISTGIQLDGYKFEFSPETREWHELGWD